MSQRYTILIHARRERERERERERVGALSPVKHELVSQLVL